MTVKITIEIENEKEAYEKKSTDCETIKIPRYVLSQADIGADTELAVCGDCGRIAVVVVYDFNDFYEDAFDGLFRDLCGIDYEFFANIGEGTYAAGGGDDILYIPQDLLDEAEISPESDLRVYKFANLVLITEDIYGEDF
ncbi:MAG: hypothetical protein LBC19_01765 [Tannerella sp.]|jgi:hypothetical protein|nr:hypothetical protein [Tannerella sp.]